MATLFQKVALQEIRIFAYHGFYPEEQLTGNEFIIDVEAEQPVFNDGMDELTNTVNYERLFAIVSSQMKEPRKLLESVAHAILNDILNEFSDVQQVKVSIRKMNLPMAGQIKNSLVELNFKR